MATGDQFDFYHSGASVLDTPQTDPDLSLGGNRSSTKLYHTEGSLTSGMTLKNEFIDSAQIGNGSISVGDWLLFVTGANPLEARKVTAFTIGTGFFRLRDPLPNLGAIGNIYRLHAVHNLFDKVSAAEAATGEAEYRGVFPEQNSGAPLVDLRCYVHLISGGATEVAVAINDVSRTAFYETLANENQEPDLSLYPSKNVRWERPTVFLAAAGMNPGNWHTGNARCLWIRRTVPETMAQQDETVWAIVIGNTDSGGDPDPLESAFLVVFEGDGYIPEVSLTADRFAHIGGGARIKAKVQSAGVNVPDEFLEYSIETGPGTIYADPGNDQTDENGEHSVAFHSPVADVVRTEGDPALEFTRVPAGDDTIDRDTGSFLADGFIATMLAAIRDSDLNDGFQTIKFAGGSQITFDGDVLATEGPTLFVEVSEATRIRVRVV